ncbi:phosphonate metabolism transcriptional regulator PhnF [Marinibaculum pumilum]|uniref:Phosphonate metabolism transcriptional regulator PhnF n=1 Tax=Marinibaculum pumilum TaxID=1766165 RepID=A0ABV7L1Z8_9PROT
MTPPPAHFPDDLAADSLSPDEAAPAGVSSEERPEDDSLPLRRGGGIAVWQQIVTLLRAEIAGGGHPPGTQLPTEAALARRYGVNRHTVRRAIAVLAEDGLLRVEQGRGTFVQPQFLDYEIGRRTRFSEIIARHRKEPSGRLIASAEVAADPRVAEALEIPAGAPCLRLETLHVADGTPLSISTNWFPVQLAPNLLAAYAETGSITQALRRDGIADYMRRQTRITAQAAGAEDAALLRQPPSRPLLVAESINVDPDGRPIQYAVTRFASDRVQIVLNS